MVSARLTPRSVSSRHIDEEREHDEQRKNSDSAGQDARRVRGSAEGLHRHLRPQDENEGGGADRRDDDRSEDGRPRQRHLEEPCRTENEEGATGRGDAEVGCTHLDHTTGGYPDSVAQENYSSGEDYVVEFHSYRFAFSVFDFEQRVTAAAVKLGLVPSNELDEDETADLVELAADGRIADAASGLGRYLVRHWERLSLVEGESLVYWLRKLVFRSAWLDHRVKEGLLEVVWDDVAADFTYRDPRGGRALLELAPVPSWHELQFRR